MLLFSCYNSSNHNDGNFNLLFFPLLLKTFRAKMEDLRGANMQWPLPAGERQGQNEQRRLREIQQREENSQRQLREMQQREENSQR